MTKTEKNVARIIHGASLAAAGVGGGLAQLPGSDAPVLVAIQTTMILAIAEELDAPITRATAAEILLTASATMGGRAVSQALVGWIPGFGNAVNAATAAGLTEAIGWAAQAYLADA